MESAKPTSKNKRSFLSKIMRVAVWVIGIVILLFILILILIQIPAVQNFGRKKIVTFLENKLETQVAIGNLGIDFPTTISLQNIYIEDQSNDTLLFGGEIKVNLDMFRLLKNDIQIEEISLNHIVANVKRLPPDTVFNFQFIVDAFATEDKKISENEDTATLKMNIDHLEVNNSHIVYKDTYTGNDLDLKIGHLETGFETFDPTHLLFNIPHITLNGLTGHFYQLEPLVQSLEKSIDVASAEEGNVLRLINEEMKFSNIDVAYKNEASNLYTSFIIGSLVIHPDALDLKNSLIALKDATLNNSQIVVRTATKEIDEVPEDTVVTTSETPSFKIIAGKININNSNINYDDQSAPHAPVGIDYAHLHLSGINLTGADILFGGDTMRATLVKASLKEQISGFILNNMVANFEMVPTGISVENLLIETPGSAIKKSISISYPSLEALQKNPSILGLDVHLEDSKITLKDLITFVPQLAEQTTSLSPLLTINIDAKITGEVANLNFQKLILSGLSATDINISGFVNGLPDPNKIYTNLNIQKFKTSRKDILAILPPNTLPSSISIPENIAASGNIKGNMENLYTNLAINTSLGRATIKGSMGQITDKADATYDMALNATNIQLGNIMQNPQLGMLTANVKVKGKGYNPKTAIATFNSTIEGITLNNYHYKNINASGNIAQSIYHVNAAIHDPNIDMTIAANGKFENNFPAVELKAAIDSIKTLPLHLTTSDIVYHGQIDGDFSNTNPDDLIGNLLITHSILVNDGERMVLDTLKIIAENKIDSRSLSLVSEIFSATIKGKYTLTQLGDVFLQAIGPYYSVTERMDTIKTAPYDFTIQAGVHNSPALKAFIPELKEMKPITMNGHFANDSGWNVSIKSPHILFGDLSIDHVDFIAATENGHLAFNASLQQLQSGSAINLYATSLYGTLKDNNLNFSLNIKDQQLKNKYNLSGLLTHPSMNSYSFSLKPDSLLLNYEKWNINPSNVIQYINKNIVAHDFILSQGNQLLSINSSSTTPDSPLEIDFNDFKIATITGFIQNDSLLVNGLLNGHASIKDLQAQPTFTTDFQINNLSIYQDTIGTLTAKVNNNIANQYHTVIGLTGHGNDINISGDYFVKPADSKFDFIVDIGAFQMSSLEGFSNGAIKNARGYLFGKIAVNGSLDKPNIDGKIHFNNTAFIVSMVDNLYKIDKESIAIINNEGIRLSTFTIRDTANNKLVIDGDINTKDFFNYSFDFGIQARNFQAISSTKKDNDLFYGKLFLSTNLQVTGTLEHPVINGEISIDENTEFTVVLPQEAPGIVQREGIVRFVDYSATAEDSLFMAPYDSLNVSPLEGFEVSVNIKVSSSAIFNLIIDQGNGDFLRLQGTGLLTAGIDASGKITLTGTYEIEEGAYNISFNFIKRKFNIQKGSRIVWTGEPTSAQIDVTAMYIANAAPLDLVKGQITGNLNIYKQKLPFEVHLLLKGELLKPEISFNIVLPEENNYNVSTDIINTVQTKLAQMRQQEGEMNKQVFALLLLNRFVGENPFNSSGGSLDANTFVRQSVSKLLTEQLNQLTEGLINGVDINFDVATTEDYTTGTKQNRTDFKVGITKSLLSDRLTVTVGKDFELEGPQQAATQHNNLIGNISINYKLSKDGKYMLKAYRKNDYTGIVEGYVIETGVAFIISIDYNKFKELFSSKEERRKEKKIERKNKAIEKKEKARQEKVQENNSSPAEKLNDDEKDN